MTVIRCKLIIQTNQNKNNQVSKVLANIERQPNSITKCIWWTASCRSKAELLGIRLIAAAWIKNTAENCLGFHGFSYINMFMI